MIDGNKRSMFERLVQISTIFDELIESLVEAHQTVDYPDREPAADNCL